MKWKSKNERARQADAKRPSSLLGRPPPQRARPWVGPRSQMPDYVDRSSGKVVRGRRLRRSLDRFAS